VAVPADALLRFSAPLARSVVPHGLMQQPLPPLLLALSTDPRRRITPVRRIPKAFPKRFVGWPVAGPLTTGAGEVSSHTFNLEKPLTKQVAALDRVGAPNVYTRQIADETIGLPGQQSCISINYASSQDLYAMGVQNTNSANGPNRYVLESVQSETVMTNQSTAPLELEIWDLVLKKDLYALNSQAWKLTGATTVTPYPVSGSPESFWREGLNAAYGLASGGALDYSAVVGSSPYDSQMFKDMFTCVKKTVVVLNQGSSHRILALQKMNTLVDQAIWSAATAAGGSVAQNGVKGISSFSLIRIKGLPCTIDDELFSGVTTTASRLAFVQFKRYKYTWVQDATAGVLYSEALLSPSVGMGIINIGSGLPEQQQFAPSGP